MAALPEAFLNVFSHTTTSSGGCLSEIMEGTRAQVQKKLFAVQFVQLELFCG